MADDEKHFEMAVDLARDTLKGLLLVNGGAAIALIALMDKSGSGKDYTGAVLWFAAGAVFAVVSSTFGYLSQLHYANHRMDSDQRMHTLHKRWQVAAIISVVATIALMVTGIVSAACAAR
jgi:hypothetical protein